MIAKYQISVWTPNSPEPETRTVVFPPDQWGTVSAAIDELRAELESNKADGMVARYQITELDSSEIDFTEARQWLEGFRDGSEL